jgi:hypothetical protein
MPRIARELSKEKRGSFFIRLDSKEEHAVSPCLTRILQEHTQPYFIIQITKTERGHFYNPHILCMHYRQVTAQPRLLSTDPLSFSRSYMRTAQPFKNEYNSKCRLWL